MLKKAAAVVALAVMLPWVGAAQDAKAVIAAASAAIGVDQLRTIQYSATGFDFALGQSYNPEAPWPKFINKSYTRAVDFQLAASRVERVRLQGENPPRGGGQQPVRGEQSQAQTIIVDGNTPWVQQLEIWMLPHGFLRAAVRNNATVKTQTVERQAVQRRHLHRPEQGGRERLHQRSESGRARRDLDRQPGPRRHAVRGGVFGVQGVRRREVPDAHRAASGRPSGVRLDGRRRAAERARSPFSRRRGAAARREAARPAAGAQAGATPSEKLADGVYLILGGYASVVVEFKDHLAIVESGQNEARGEAVIAEAKRLVPNKPIRYIVNTHHHFDHSSGLRPLVAEGATIVTHQINKSFYERVFTAPRTLNPDRLARSPRKPAVDAMTDRKVMTDGNQTLELHHLRGSGHNEGIIVAYLPKERILIEADAYNPPADPAAPMPVPPSPYTVNLLENIERLRLEPARIIAVHYPADGRVVTKEELMKAAGRSGSTSQ